MVVVVTLVVVIVVVVVLSSGSSDSSGVVVVLSDPVAGGGWAGSPMPPQCAPGTWDCNTLLALCRGGDVAWDGDGSCSNDSVIR